MFRKCRIILCFCFVNKMGLLLQNLTCCSPSRFLLSNKKFPRVLQFAAVYFVHSTNSHCLWSTLRSIKKHHVFFYWEFFSLFPPVGGRSDLNSKLEVCLLFAATAVGHYGASCWKPGELGGRTTTAAVPMLAFMYKAFASFAITFLIKAVVDHFVEVRVHL